MGRYVAKRLGLAIMTLFLLSVLVFVAGQVLPGSPSRSILGNFASEQAVAQMDRQLGLDQPLPVQYWNWVSGLVTGDLGTSYQYQAPVGSFLVPALVQSLKLAGVAFVLVVPLSIIGGVTAAVHRGKLLDRVISTSGMTLVTVPQFVAGVVLIVVFAIQLKVAAGDRQRTTGLRSPDLSCAISFSPRSRWC